MDEIKDRPRGVMVFALWRIHKFFDGRKILMVEDIILLREDPYNEDTRKGSMMNMKWMPLTVTWKEIM